MRRLPLDDLLFMFEVTMQSLSLKTKTYNLKLITQNLKPCFY